MNIPLNFTARDYQAEALTALDQGVIISIWCWARRAGKDFTAFAYAVKKMVETPMNVALIFPTKQQGYESFWTNVENDGMLTLDHIPASLIASRTNSPSNMKITLKNGSSFTVLGASEPDSLRGANAKLYIFSEFVDIPVAALDVIRPIIAVNHGQIIIQSTPKIDGISGGTFKILFDRALKNWTSGKKTQYASRVTAEHYLTKDQLEELREEAIAKNGNDFFYRQEFLVDWGQASSSAYYAHIIQQLRKRQGIGHFPHDTSRPVFTAWDLGTSDSTAIVFFQIVNKRLRIIDYYETHDMKYSAIVKFTLAKPYNYGWHFFPHDGSVRDEELTTRLNKLQDFGLINSSLLKRESREAGINRVTEMLPKAEINEATTLELVRKMILYKRKYNGLTGDYEGPEHKTESHAADSFKYVCKAIEDEFDMQTGEHLYSPANAQSTYESDSFVTPGQYNPWS